jgi:hypothetical protein
MIYQISRSSVNEKSKESEGKSIRVEKQIWMWAENKQNNKNGLCYVQLLFYLKIKLIKTKN